MQHQSRRGEPVSQRAEAPQPAPASKEKQNAFGVDHFPASPLMIFSRIARISEPFHADVQRAYFDGFGKTSAFASGPPCTSADGNEGKNLRQAQQRAFGKGDVHKSSPLSIFAKRIIGFSPALFSRENRTTG
jgi:hypothetical protein